MTTIGELKGKARYTTAEILAFYSSSLEFANKATAAALSCTPELLATLTVAVQALQELVHRDSKSQQTDLIANYDGLRDADITTTYALIEAYAYSPIAAMAELGKPLQEATRLYRTTAKSALAAETVEVKGLLEILKRDDLQDAINAIANLPELIADMELNNNLVEQTMNDRNAVKVDKALNDEKRAAADAAYNAIILRANASVVLLPSDAIDTFVTEINNLIKRTEDVYNQRMGKKHAKEDKKEI